MGTQWSGWYAPARRKRTARAAANCAKRRTEDQGRRAMREGLSTSRGIRIRATWKASHSALTGHKLMARLRFGIILAKQGGALPQMMRPFKFGVGGRIGSGQQWMSWITLEDTVAVIRKVLENRAVNGAVNVVGPQAVRNVDFAQTLGRAMHRLAILPTPAFPPHLALAEMAAALPH